MTDSSQYDQIRNEQDKNVRTVALSGGTAMALGALTALIVEATHGGTAASVGPRPPEHSITIPAQPAPQDV